MGGGVSRIEIRDIQHATAYHFGVEVSGLIAPGRTKDIVLPRQIAMYLSRELTRQSLPAIGNRFGGRDHSTVLHAIRRIDGRRSEPAIAAALACVRSRAIVLALGRSTVTPRLPAPSPIAVPHAGVGSATIASRGGW